jgi:hypothetical protein
MNSMKLQDGIAATVRKSAVYALMTFPVVPGSATTAATLLSPTPTLNSRVVPWSICLGLKGNRSRQALERPPIKRS